MTISSTEFGKVEDSELFLYHISNGHMSIEVSNYGCTIVSVLTPDKWGNKINIVAGFKDFHSYTLDRAYLGCIIGRYSNRIASGKFSIDGNDYQLSINDGINHLHGGFQGFDKKIWNVEKLIDNDHEAGVIFSYFSEDGEEGYPGNLMVFVTYILTKENEVKIQYNAATDIPTIISLTNHSYFNLTGFEEETVYGHYLQINADSFTVKSADNTSTGEISHVEETVLDFRVPKKIGRHIHHLKTDMGYDHNYVLRKDGDPPWLAACLFEENSGRMVRIYTDQPALQLYSSNWWDGKSIGYQNKPYCKHGAIALETQAFPDAPNHSNFPGVILYPGEPYKKETVLQFSIADSI